MTATIPQMRPELAFRGASPEELALISDSWVRSHWQAEGRRKFEPDVYFPMQRRLVRRLLQRSYVLVAICPAAPEEVLSWLVFELCGEVLAIHYCYTKRDFRRIGIARLLIGAAQKVAPGSPLQFTHKADARWKRFAESLGAVFNPFLLGE